MSLGTVVVANCEAYSCGHPTELARQLHPLECNIWWEGGRSNKSLKQCAVLYIGSFHCMRDSKMNNSAPAHGMLVGGGGRGVSCLDLT